jgi:hypothetical protein
MTTLGDRIRDMIEEAISDVVSDANYRENELLLRINELELEVERLKQLLATNEE